MKLLSIFSAIALLSALPATAQTQFSTEFKSESFRPNKEDNFGITQSARFKLEKSTIGQFQAGWKQYNLDGENRAIVPIRLTVENIPSLNQVRLQGTIGIDLIEGQKDQLFGAIDARIPIGENAALSGTISTSAFLGSAQAIDEGLRQVQFSPRLNWKVDPKTNLLLVFTQAWISDGNERKQINFRLEYDLGSGLYVAGTAFYVDSKKETSLDYWTPQNYLAVGPEVGARFPISKTAACQVGVRPIYVREDGERDKFKVGGGAGCQFRLSSTTNLRVQAIGGYGLTTTAKLEYRF